MPVTAPQQPAFSMVDASGMVIVARRCISCSYNLMGLSKDGPCPECGTPVAHSLRDNLLINSAPEYLARIHKGVFLVQTSIIVLIVATVLTMLMSVIGVAMAPGAAGGFVTSVSFSLVTAGLAIVPALIGLYGWWLFSEADPRASENDRGEKPRRIVRTTVVVELALMVCSQAASIAMQMAVTTPLRGGTTTPATPGAAVAAFPLVLTIAVGLLAGAYYIAMAVRFFASMLYIRWLAPRLPNEKAHNRGKLMLWLGPLLCTVGMLACYIGPLVALVLYYNLLEWVRVDLKRIRKTLELKALMPITPAPEQPA